MRFAARRGTPLQTLDKTSLHVKTLKKRKLYSEYQCSSTLLKTTERRTTSMPTAPSTDKPPHLIGAIFDWDGVVIDSHDQHRESWFQLAEQIGRPMTAELFSESFGMRNEQIIPDLFQWADSADTEAIQQLADEKEELYRELIRRDGLQPLDGAETLLRQLKENGIPCSVGSSTPHKNIQASMELIGLNDCFQAITASEDVRQGKPDPEVFLIAANRIDRQPKNCVVFEDAHAGIKAGNAAGMHTIAVTTTHPANTFIDLADRVVESLNEIKIEQLIELLK